MHFDEKRKQLCNLENKKNIPDIDIGNSLDSGSEILRSGFFLGSSDLCPDPGCKLPILSPIPNLRLILWDHPERNILRNSTLL